MKLRFKGNTLRLRLNQSEVRSVAAGMPLEEHVVFPGHTQLSYILQPAETSTAARFDSGVITVSAPLRDVQSWAASDEIGLYFDVPAEQKVLRIAVEKDLECVDAPTADRDPDAFPRTGAAPSC